MNDGSRLEQLVSLIEGLRLPEGFHVRTNRREFDSNGTIIAEFDIEIEGPVGSSTYRWLIECRDRPSDGPAPAAWIEQLVGRRDRFRYDKVMAVSTTGFAKGALDYARERGIDTRAMDVLQPEKFSHWLSVTHINQVIQTVSLTAGAIGLGPETSDEQMAAAGEIIRSLTGNTRALRSSKDGAMNSMAEALLGVVSANNLFELASLDGTPKRLRLKVQYTNDLDCFYLDTTAGAIRIHEINFEGEIVRKHTVVPFSMASSYRRVDTGEVISDSIVYECEGLGYEQSVSLHRFADTGETIVVLKAPEALNPDIKITAAQLREKPGG